MTRINMCPAGGKVAIHENSEDVSCDKDREVITRGKINLRTWRSRSFSPLLK